MTDNAITEEVTAQEDPPPPPPPPPVLWFETQLIQDRIPPEIKFFFKINPSGCLETGVKKILRFDCSMCSASRKLTLGTGWTNLTQHLTQQHPDWKTMWDDGKGDKSKLTNYFCTKSSRVLGWLGMIVELGLSFNFVTYNTARRNVKHAPICKNTLIKYAEKICEIVEKKISTVLSDAFGLILDGWTEQGVHFVALFARFIPKSSKTEKVEEVLLACSPLYHEGDLSAESHKEFVIRTLRLYEKGLENILFVTGDNASVNLLLADLLEVKFIGCYSHKLALAMKHVIAPYEEYIERIAEIMTMLKGVKRSAALRERGAKKVPVLRNSTRWSSIFKMMDRFFYLMPFFDLTDQDLIQRVPFEAIDSLKALQVKLKIFNEVTVALQKQDLCISEARDYFEEVLFRYPNEGFEQYLRQDAAIVKNPEFESAIVKVIRGQVDELFAEERMSLTKFERLRVPVNVEEEKKQEESIVRAVKRRKSTPSSSYISMKLITCTSNTVERFFSMCGQVWSKQRRRMSPYHLEMLLFLKLNRSYWDISVVKMAIEQLKNMNDERDNHNIESSDEEDDEAEQ